eukprot:15197582-Ditylum_brightwellii.AAC.1
MERKIHTAQRNDRKEEWHHDGSSMKTAVSLVPNLANLPNNQLEYSSCTNEEENAPTKINRGLIDPQQGPLSLHNVPLHLWKTGVC